jgi:hypothetical protein
MRLSVADFDVFLEDATIKELEQVTTIIYNGVTRRTPVYSGRAKASWNVGLGKSDIEPHPDTGSPDAPIVTSPLNGLKLKKVQPVYISNGIPYIIYLENGSPTTGASAMVAATLSKF